MHPAPHLTTFVLLAGCATADRSPPRPEGVRRIAITRPTIIGYFPAVTDAELDDSDGLSSALDHLQIALEKSDACFGSKGVSVQAVFADEIAVVYDGRVQEIVPMRKPDGIGAFLVAPGRPGRVVHAGRGPSSLVFYLPAAASEYFQLPPCDSTEPHDPP